MKSIRTKLITYFSILILVSSVSLGAISLIRSSQTITSESEKSLASLAFEAARLTHSRIETQLRTLEVIALREDIQSMDWKVQQPILKDYVKNTGLLDIAVVQLDGTAYYSEGNTAKLSDREYIKKALNGEANVSDVLISSVTKDIVLMYATPIKREDKIVGVLIGRRDGNSLSQIADDTGFGEEGYGYVINDKGTVVGHPNREMVITQYNPIEESENDESQKSVADLLKKALAEKSGASDYTFQGKDLYSGYAPVEGTNWTFIITANADEVLAALP